MKNLCLSIQLVFLISSLMFAQAEWEYIGLSGINIWDIEIDGLGNIYVGVEQGPIYKSTDNGVTWELKNNGFTSSFGEDIAIYDNQIYVTTLTGLFKSTNGGDNWFRIAQSIPFLDFDKVSVIPNGYIFTSVFNMGTGGVFRSTDEGVTWEATSYTGFGAIDIGINLNGVMFLGNQTASWYGIQRSFDLGMHWEWIIPYMATSALEYLNDGSVLAGVTFIPSTNESGIYKTTTNGNTWFNTNTFIGMIDFSDFVLDTNNDIYVGVGGVYLSIDNGGSWEYRGLSNLEVYCLAIDSSGYLYAGTHNNGIFRTSGRTTPVELVSFSAVVNESNVELSWITATELNNSGFEIERKELGVRSQKLEWNAIGFVPGFGTTIETKSYSFIDEYITTGNYKYRLKQINFDGSFEYSNEINIKIDLTPKEFVIHQNYPNPFNPITTIRYSIPEDGIVTLKVFDALGKEVRNFRGEEKEAGEYDIKFDGSALTSGVYIYQLQAGSFVATKKMILLK